MFNTNRNSKDNKATVREKKREVVRRVKRPEEPVNLSIPQGTHWILPLAVLLGNVVPVVGAVVGNTPGTKGAPRPEPEYRQNTARQAPPPVRTTSLSPSDTALKQQVEQSFCPTVSPLQREAITNSILAMSPGHKQNAAACLLGPELKGEDKCIINVREGSHSIAKAVATRETIIDEVTKTDGSSAYTATHSAPIISVYQDNYAFNPNDQYTLSSDLAHELEHCVDHLGLFPPLEIEGPMQEQDVRKRLNGYNLITFTNPEETERYKKLFSGFTERVNHRLESNPSDTREYFYKIGLTALENYNESSGIFSKIKEEWIRDKIKNLGEKLLKKEALNPEDTAKVGRFVSTIVSKVYCPSIMESGHGMVSEIAAYLNSICPALRKAIDVKMDKFVTELATTLRERVVSQFKPETRAKYDKMTGGTPASQLHEASSSTPQGHREL